MTETRDRRVVFLYLLLRDKLVAGDVEELVTEALEPMAVCQLPSDPLAQLAIDAVQRLDEGSPSVAVALDAKRAEMLRVLADMPDEAFQTIVAMFQDVADAKGGYQEASRVSFETLQVVARKFFETVNAGGAPS